MIEIFQAFVSGLTGALGAPMLPLLPALLAWAWASSRDGGAIAPVGFAASFALGFVLLNFGAGWLVDHADFGAVLAGFAIASYGLHAMNAIRLPGAQHGAPLLGFAFAFGWAPLPSASLADAAEFGALATAAYGAGLALFAWLPNPVLIRILRDISSRVPGDAHAHAIVAGLTLFATGLAIAAGLFAELGFALDENFPALRYLG
jgi:cytochrome c biogenesis protein CcdA